MDESESLTVNGEQEIGDEFYEKIEAPKFVDLTAPDPFQPGQDRSWFCLRTGCDQNHDEEMDSEAIYKNFVLRVMAARSPNVRFRRALCRKDSSLDIKCPMTVPAKPSKSRITRTALISSASKRIVDPEVDIKPLLKQNPTPKDKAKALTTPRSKKQLENAEAFQSGRNPRTKANIDSDSRVVTKTLFFDSPKKATRTKISEELKEPLNTLCTGMKKLEITGKKKLSLGCNRPLPSKTSQKQIRRRDVKSRVFDGLNIQKGKVQQANSSKCLEKNKKGNNLQKNSDSVCSGKVENDFGIKIDVKKTIASGEVCSTTASVDRKKPEWILRATGISRPLSKRNNAEALTDSCRIESSAVFSDDKENALASDENRKLDVKTSHKIFGQHKNQKGNREKTTEKSKQLKENSAPASNASHCLKIKRPKHTNPKPFQLRTDERGILKEANICEMAAVSKVAGGNSLEKHQNASKRDAKFPEQNEKHEDSEKERQELHQPKNRTYRAKIGNERIEHKMPSILERHTISSKQKLVVSQQKTSQENSTSKSDNIPRKSKPLSTRQLPRLKEKASNKTEMAGKLGATKEAIPTYLRARESTKQRQNGAP